LRGNQKSKRMTVVCVPLDSPNNTFSHTVESYLILGFPVKLSYSSVYHFLSFNSRSLVHQRMLYECVWIYMWLTAIHRYSIRSFTQIAQPVFWETDGFYVSSRSLEIHNSLLLSISELNRWCNRKNCQTTNCISVTASWHFCFLLWSILVSGILLFRSLRSFLCNI